MRSSLASGSVRYSRPFRDACGGLSGPGAPALAGRRPAGQPEACPSSQEARDAPTTPPAIRARFNYHEAHERAAARPRRRPGMPSPAGCVARIAAGLLEVEAGARPGRQLEPLCHPTLWAALVRRLPRSGGAAITACSLRRVVVQEHTPGLVEGVALLQRGGRLEPVAMRLDGALGRWQVVVLQYSSAAGAPHQEGADR